MAKADEKPKLSREDEYSRAGNLHVIAADYGDVASIPDELLIKRVEGTKDTPAVAVLRDGTKVTDELLEEKLSAAMKDDPDFRDEVIERRRASRKGKGESKDLDKGKGSAQSGSTGSGSGGAGSGQ